MIDAARRVPLVLFLIADTGGGHRSAANAIQAAMDLIAPEESVVERPALSSRIAAAALSFDPQTYQPAGWDATPHPWRAEIRDLFQECGRFPLPQTAHLYGPVVATSPRLYATFYHATNTGPTYVALATMTETLLRGDLEQLLRRLRPEVIVSVHPMLTRPALSILRHLGVRVPFLTVVTDLVRFHRSWATPAVDACVVPTEAARDLLIAQGMPAAKLRVMGMPIHPKFVATPPDRAATLRQLGLDPARRTVLALGGGEGLGNLGEIALALGAMESPIQQIVVTGRNQALYDRLMARRAEFAIPTAILGFTQLMPELMRAADVIVTKAGPGAIAEALACDTPLILTSAIPGQEIANIDYVTSQGAGSYAPTPAGVVAAVRAALESDAARLAAMRVNAQRLSHPRASFAIGQFILSHIPARGAPSAWATVSRLATRRLAAPRLAEPRPAGRARSPGRPTRRGR